MKLILRGHDYKYALEQMLLTLFPTERPEYTENILKDDFFARSTLYYGEKFATSVTTISSDGHVTRGYSRVARSRLDGGRSGERLLQKAVKLSFYKAAVALTGHRPAWGSLTGIRPTVLAVRFHDSGLSDKAVMRAMEREYSVERSRAELLGDTMRASISVRGALGKNDVCLYIGIPFCPTRCAYCSFVSSSVESSGGLIVPFLSALQRELRACGDMTRKLGLRVISVYLGGGTPTTLTATQLGGLFTELRNAFDCSYLSELTVEAGRPDTITPDKLAALKQAGVTRISVNPQTLADEVLGIIGRRHTRADFFEAYRLALNAGFERVNTDLIAGLPGDTEEGFRTTLNEVIALGPCNITVHTLSLKRGSKIKTEGIAAPDGATVGRMLGYATHRLRGAGYKPYYLYRQKYTSGGFENTGWCLPGAESLYNICMMEEHASVLALGGGAVTKLVFPEGRIERVFNPKYPKEYIERIDKICEEKFDEITGML